jgi:iron complex transport system substrate-binding protein
MKYYSYFKVPAEAIIARRMKVPGKRRRNLKGLIFVFLILLFSTVFCSSSVASREIFDMAGRRVDIPDSIRSVYGCSPPGTYLLYALAPDLIAGLNFPLNPAQKKILPDVIKGLPVIGGWFGQGRTPNLETLLTVKPDIAIVSSFSGFGIDEKIEKILTTFGIPTVYVRLDSMAEYPEALRFLGSLLGREERGNKLADYTTQTLEEIRKVLESIPVSDRLAVYYAESGDGLRSECDKSFHAELIPLCGGKNVHICETCSLIGMEKVSLEQVLYYAPQVILTHETAFFDGIFSNASWQSIPAVHNRKVFLIPSLPFNWFDRPPSFMRFLGAKWLLQKLYPDACTIDIVAETRSFFKLFLDISLSDGEVRRLLAP